MCIVIGPPKITYTSSAILSFEGRKVKLTCNATNDVDAVHPVQIKWYNSKGKLVQIANKHVLIYSNINNVTGEIQSVLLFDPASHTDTGMYTCRAYNHPQCYNEDEVSLTVECEFSILQKPVDLMYTFSCNCVSTVCDGILQHHYNLYSIVILSRCRAL